MTTLLKEKQKAIIEALLFVNTQPVPLAKMVKKLRLVSRRERGQGESALPQEQDLLDSEGGSFAFAQDDTMAANDNNQDDVLKQLLNKQKELEDDITAADVKNILTEIQDELSKSEHGLELVAVAKGYQLRTKYDVAVYLKDEKLKTPSRFSPSSLETLAIVAYQQPITRQKLEEIRGVDSGGVLKTLLDKSILRVVGRSEEPGKPLVYGTSSRFLEIFGLKNLNDMPSLEDYHSLNISAKRDEERGDRFDTSDIVIDDLVDSQFVDDMNQDDQELISDLDNSLKDLKSVEKEIFPPAEALPLESTKENVSLETHITKS